MFIRSSIAEGRRLTIAAILVVAACSDQSLGPLEPEFAASTSSVQSVTVSTVVSPVESTVGDSVTVEVSVTNNTTKGIKVVVAENIRDPLGNPSRSNSWPEQSIGAGKTIKLVDRFATAADAVTGTYSVGVKVSTRSGTSYYDNSNAARFTLAAPTVAVYQYTRQADPARTLVHDAAGKWVATFTDGAYTVALAGAVRSFTEPNDTARITHTTWVRVLSSPFNGKIDESWLTNALADQSPDVLQLAMQYIAGAPALYDGAGLKIAGDADYGPLQADGTLQEGSDFNDYLGISWSYGSTVDKPESTQLGSLDCSGFMRMVLGYRGGLPLSLDPNGIGIPRRAFQILDSAPGVVTTPNTGNQVTDFSRLAPGDLVFFDAATDDGTQIDHVGLYLGVDFGGNYRFISSRKSINGPTFGDYKGRSVLNTINGGGLYALGFRAARRL